MCIFSILPHFVCRIPDEARYLVHPCWFLSLRSGLERQWHRLSINNRSTLSFNSNVSNACKASYSHLQALKYTRPILTKDIALSIDGAIVQSRLDYANSVLYHTSSQNINKLQRTQTMAPRLVAGNRQIPATDLLSHHQWLPVAKRIHFKTATLTCKVLSTQQPAYLRSLINCQARELRSSALHELHQPVARKTVCQRAHF
jgi:hypothetical protein